MSEIKRYELYTDGFDNFRMKEVPNGEFVRFEYFDKQRALIETLVNAVGAAHGFISNGIDLGYISLPHPDSNDPALKTPAIVAAALGAAKKEGF